MVFKHILANLLDKYLGKYIEDVDLKKLKVDLWHGNVILENVHLKPDALTNSNFPVTIITGYLRKLSLHVSWKHVYTHPIKIIIDGIYIVAEPDTEIKYNAEEEERKQYDAKMKEVLKIEEFQQEKEEFENAKKSPRHKDTFLERLELHLIRNLEVSISNLHIAFEDKKTKSHHPFSFGITLNYVKLLATNAEWEYIESEEHSPVMYKFGEVNALSVYWNSNVELRSDLSEEVLLNDLHAKIATNDRKSVENLVYILSPSNLTAKLKIARLPSQQDYTRPVLDAQIDLEQIDLSISHDQYMDLLDLLEFRDEIRLRTKYIKYYATIEGDKPSVRRWKFAYAAVLNEAVRPHLAYNKWENIRANLDRCRDYYTLYYKELREKATKEEKQRARELEKQIDVLNLVLIRRNAQLEVKKKKIEKKQQSWWEKLSGWWKHDSNNTDPDLDFQDATTDDDGIEKFYDAIGYNEDHKSSSYPDTYVDIDLSIQLTRLEMNVWSKIDPNNSHVQVIAQATMSDTSLMLQRRPATSAIQAIADMNSVGLYGVAIDVNEGETINNHRPALIQPINLSQKLVHWEFETNPVDSDADYRIEAASQPLEIIYDAMTINSLIECFRPQVHHELKGVKKAVYSIYADISHQLQFLLNYHLRNIKGLDIDIDCQSVYILLPNNGAYHTESSILCLDFGHFTVQGGRKQVDKVDEDKFEDAQSTANRIDPSYIPLEARLEDIRLLYAKSNEDWTNAKDSQDSRMHLIKPFTFGLDVLKCIFVDNTALPLWKINAQVSPVHSRLSNTRLLGLMTLFQSITLPQSSNPPSETETVEELFMSDDTIPEKNTKKIFETIENMAPMKRYYQKMQNTEEEEEEEEESDEQIQEENKEKTDHSEAQLIEVQATLDIPHIDILIEETLSDKSDETEPFLRISLISFAAQAIVKTFDIEVDASITNLIIAHEQFLTNNNKPLRLLSMVDDEKLLSAQCLFTSPENPLFYSPTYNRIENKVRVHLSKPIAMLQIEALVSILRFQNDLMKKVSQQATTIKTKTQPSAEKPISNNDTKKKSFSSISTSLLEADLEEFRMIVGTDFAQVLDLQLQGVLINVSQSTGKTAIGLILNDIRILDLHRNTQYPTIISRQDQNIQILHFDFTTYNYSEKHEKKLGEVDYDVQICLAKMNIIFLYKYINLFLNIFNGFKMKKTKKVTPSPPKTNSDAGILQKLQDRHWKIRFDVNINAPTIFVPIDSHLNEGISIDLGQLVLKTHLLNDPEQSHAEQQILIFKDFLITRVKLNNNNEILGDIILLECAEFHTWIGRLLRTDETTDQIEVLIKIKWDTINLTMSKDDYGCLMKILKENFSEQIYPKISPANSQEELEDVPKADEQAMPDAPITKQTDVITKEIHLDFEIKRIAATLFFDESNLTVRHASRNKDSKFLKMHMEMIEAHFQQFSDASYNGRAQIQSFLLDDLRQTNPPENETHLLNRSFNVDKHTPMLAATVDFKPNDPTHVTGVRYVHAELESFCLWLSPDCVMGLKEFFNSTQSSDKEIKSQSSMNDPSSPLSTKDDHLPAPAKPISRRHSFDRQSIDEVSTSSVPEEKTEISPAPPDEISPDRRNGIETRVNVLIKTPQICWLEDQHNTNSNCLVIDFAFQMQMVMKHGETHLSGLLEGLRVYTSKFAELKDDKIIYLILEPMNIDIALSMNSEEQNFDVEVGSISIIIAPTVMPAIASIINSMSDVPATNVDKKEKINSKSLFDPKPFKDAAFWFLEDAEINQEIIEKMDILEITTGAPSEKKAVIKDKKKQKKRKQTVNRRTQQLIFNTKIIEVRLERGLDTTTKAVLALCLSNLSVDLKNWSYDMNIDSRIEVELALFNDHILAWEPLIDPIVDERGEVISPWCIVCETIEEAEENENEYSAEQQDTSNSKRPRCLSHRQESKSTTDEAGNDIASSFNAKSKVHIRAEHLFNVTITKTSIDAIQQLVSAFMDAYKKDKASENITDDGIDDESVLSALNMSGYEVFISDITGVELVENNKSETSAVLKQEESLSMTVPSERLSATHIPAIAEQIAKRRQEFSVQINENMFKVDINQTCRRVYELGPSPIPNWPIQLLCNSEIYRDRRRVVFCSIIKIHNRTIMPLVLLDADSVVAKTYQILCRINANEDYYLPIQPLYTHSSPRLFISIDEDDSTETVIDFISFDWTNEITIDRKLKTKNGEEFHIVIYKESIAAYSENTDEPIRTSFDIYIKLALHLINLLPIDIQCSIDKADSVDLKPSELYHSTSGFKRSILVFTIPSYNNKKWISDAIDLHKKESHSDNEHMVLFRDLETQDILRMVLRVDTYRDSFRASLYSPYWILNCTDRKFEFKIEEDKSVIDVVDSPFFVCPRKFVGEAHKKKGHIRLYSMEQEDSLSHWSEAFSLHVIKSTGLTSCKVLHGRIYTICISIATSSFGLTKIIKLSPSVAIINKSTVEIEVIEIESEVEQGDWVLVKPDQIISFWPHGIKESVMGVRYAHNRSSVATFPMNDKHRTLLRMDDDDRPALHVEVTLTSFSGIYIVFGDYKIGDAPVLLVNCLRNQVVTYGQKEDTRIELLSSQHYVYYTWIDTFKPHELSISCNGQNATVELYPNCGTLDFEDGNRIFYAVFHDGPQTVLIFAETQSVIEAASGFKNDSSLLSELMDQYLEISFNEIGISVINDVTQEDLLYITINKSKEIWTETRKFLLKPLSRGLNHDLEKTYHTHVKHLQAHRTDREWEERKYHLRRHRDVLFHKNTAEIFDPKGKRVRVQRQPLDGLWIGLAWSSSSAVLHLRVNHIQIDNQLDYTVFPVVFHPIVSKTAGTNTPGKPFIQWSVFKTTVARSKTVHFKYFKLLIQEFVFCADQGLLVSLFSFIKSEKKTAAPTINMDADLKSIEEPLKAIVDTQVENQSGEMKIYFNCIYLSPVKIHVSFSMHGTKPSELLLAEYPLAEFLLNLLNIAEVENVILKLNSYEREKDRFTIAKLRTEITTHYLHQLLKQIHVVVLGLDVLGNPFGAIRGVAEGVKSFFYEPYKGASDGALGFAEGVASGAEILVGSAVGGAAGIGSKITGTISKGLATLTFDDDYETTRAQRKDLTAQTTPEIVQSGKNVFKDIIHGVKGVVKRPIEGAKEDGTAGFMKGLGKGFIGLVARPTSGIADLTSTSLELIKRTVTQEEVVYRIRHARHIGRDRIVRPSIAYETNGLFIFNRLDVDKFIKSNDYIAHICCSENESGWLLATTKHLMLVIQSPSDSNVYAIDWHFHYRELKEPPIVKFNPDQIELYFKEPKVFRQTTKDHEHKKTIDCQNIGEARYIVDKITEILHAKEF